MIYREFSPNGILSEFIDQYWIVQNQIHSPGKYKILPDGYSDFIFCLSGVAMPKANENSLSLCEAYYVGAMTVFSELTALPTRLDLLGIRFKPGGLSVFCDIPLHEFRNLRINNEESAFLFPPGFTGRLCELQTTGERIAEIENFLITRLSKHFIPDRQVHFAVKQIHASHGQVSVNNLMEKICLCQRHFERKFKHHTGYSPKEFARIARFRHTTHLLQSTLPLNYQHLAMDCGYYDHSHMAKEFRQLSGASLTEFCDFPDKGPIEM